MRSDVEIIFRPLRVFVFHRMGDLPFDGERIGGGQAAPNEPSGKAENACLISSRASSSPALHRLAAPHHRTGHGAAYGAARTAHDALHAIFRNTPAGEEVARHAHYPKENHRFRPLHYGKRLPAGLAAGSHISGEQPLLVDLLPGHPRLEPDGTAAVALAGAVHAQLKQVHAFDVEIFAFLHVTLAPDRRRLPDFLVVA